MVHVLAACTITTTAKIEDIVKYAQMRQKRLVAFESGNHGPQYYKVFFSEFLLSIPEEYMHVSDFWMHRQVVDRKTGCTERIKVYTFNTYWLHTKEILKIFSFLLKVFRIKYFVKKASYTIFLVNFLCHCRFPCSPFFFGIATLWFHSFAYLQLSTLKKSTSEMLCLLWIPFVLLCLKYLVPCWIIVQASNLVGQLITLRGKSIPTTVTTPYNEFTK